MSNLDSDGLFTEDDQGNWSRLPHANEFEDMASPHPISRVKSFFGRPGEREVENYLRAGWELLSVMVSEPNVVAYTLVYRGV